MPLQAASGQGWPLVSALTGFADHVACAATDHVDEAAGASARIVVVGWS